MTFAALSNMSANHNFHFLQLLLETVISKVNHLSLSIYHVCEGSHSFIQVILRQKHLN